MQNTENTAGNLMSALICLKAESKEKGFCFSFSRFAKKHNLNRSFILAVYALKIYSREDGWKYKNKIDSDLINQLILKIAEYDKRVQKYGSSKKKKRIFELIEPYLDDTKNLYVFVNNESKTKIPEELNSKVISLDNGYKFINIKHLIDHGSRF